MLKKVYEGIDLTLHPSSSPYLFVCSMILNCARLYLTLKGTWYGNSEINIRAEESCQPIIAVSLLVGTIQLCQSDISTSWKFRLKLLLAISLLKSTVDVYVLTGVSESLLFLITESDTILSACAFLLCFLIVIINNHEKNSPFTSNLN